MGKSRFHKNLKTVNGYSWTFTKMVHLCKKYLSLKLLITYNGLGNVTFPLNTKSPKSRFPPQKFYNIDHPEREKVDDAGHRISRRKLRELESDQVLGKLQSDQRVSADGVQAAGEGQQLELEVRR